MSPTLSIVVPAFNRPEPLKFTLRSAARAAERLKDKVELLLVDDGSEPPIEQALHGFDARLPIRHLRQSNQGSIVARLAGLASARGEFVHFLDSDDLVHPDKYAAQIRVHRSQSADVTYDDPATAVLGADYSVERFEQEGELPAVSEPARLFLEVQPAPHGPIYRRDYLQGALSNPLVTPSRSMDPAGDVWLYYNLSALPARIAKVVGAHTAPGPHEEDRFSRQWERLGVASLLIMEAFVAACPDTREGRAARIVAGEVAFRSWRALPRGFHAGFERRLLAVWQRAPHEKNARLGTGAFIRLARLVGPVVAARLLRLLRAKPYSSVRTLEGNAYARLFAEFDGVAPLR